MCNRYRPARGDLLDYLEELGISHLPSNAHVGHPIGLWPKDIGPRQRGAFLRPRGDGLEEVLGQWGLIGDGWPEPVKKLKRVVRGKERWEPQMTNNARSETIGKLQTFRGPWSRGQRCIIPAAWHVEPNWESGKNEWWRIRARRARAYVLAGVWNDWTDPATGEVIGSYTMVTVQCNDHPLLNRMHRPDTDDSGAPLPMAQQDKRAVVPLLSVDAIRRWLHGSNGEALAALQLPPAEDLEAGPESATAGPLL